MASLRRMGLADRWKVQQDHREKRRRKELCRIWKMQRVGVAKTARPSTVVSTRGAALFRPQRHFSGNLLAKI
jgi:hypothetical protein